MSFAVIVHPKRMSGDLIPVAPLKLLSNPPPLSSDHAPRDGKTCDQGQPATDPRQNLKGDGVSP